MTNQYGYPPGVLEWLEALAREESIKKGLTDVGSMAGSNSNISDLPDGNVTFSKNLLLNLLQGNHTRNNTSYAIQTVSNVDETNTKETAKETENDGKEKNLQETDQPLFTEKDQIYFHPVVTSAYSCLARQSIMMLQRHGIRSIKYRDGYIKRPEEPLYTIEEKAAALGILCEVTPGESVSFQKNIWIKGQERECFFIIRLDELKEATGKERISINNCTVLPLTLFLFNEMEKNKHHESLTIQSDRLIQAGLYHPKQAKTKAFYNDLRSNFAILECFYFMDEDGNVVPIFDEIGFQSTCLHAVRNSGFKPEILAAEYINFPEIDSRLSVHEKELLHYLLSQIRQPGNAYKIKARKPIKLRLASIFRQRGQEYTRHLLRDRIDPLALEIEHINKAWIHYTGRTNLQISLVCIDKNGKEMQPDSLDGCSPFQTVEHGYIQIEIKGKYRKVLVHSLAAVINQYRAKQKKKNHRKS